MKKYELRLDVLSIHDVERIRKARNKVAKNGVYRTPFLLTNEMQRDFYNNVINNRSSNNRYFSLKVDEIEPETKEETKETTKCYVFNETIGIVGLTNIEWENGISEIALTLIDNWTGKGLGRKAVILILEKAFKELRLKNVYGECYQCNPSLVFWVKMREEFGTYHTLLFQKKFFNGGYYDSYYFNFSDFRFNEIIENTMNTNKGVANE